MRISEGKKEVGERIREEEKIANFKIRPGQTEIAYKIPIYYFQGGGRAGRDNGHIFVSLNWFSAFQKCPYAETMCQFLFGLKTMGVSLFTLCSTPFVIPPSSNTSPHIPMALTATAPAR